MMTVMILTAFYLIALSAKKIWGGKFTGIPFFRDFDLSLNGFVSALGIVVLIAAGITAGSFGGLLDERVSGSNDVKTVQSGTPALSAPVPAADSAAASAASSEYADGTYSGTGTGFRGPITVAVQVAGGVISKVEVTDQQDDRKWFERAYSGVVQSILSAQGTNVDTVSGATYSSHGIIDGAAAALEQARAAVK